MYIEIYCLFQIGQLQDRLRDGQVSNKDHHSVLKSELARRDETIQKLRRDVLNLQEKRDTAVAEVNYKNLDYCRLFWYCRLFSY